MIFGTFVGALVRHSSPRGKFSTVFISHSILSPYGGLYGGIREAEALSSRQADRFGRKNLSIAYCALYILSVRARPPC
jgi:hypothetical protein